MKSKKNLSLIIIPTYNEQKNIKLIINKIKKNLSFNYNVLFVDDNSNDGTKEILKKIKNKKISYIIRNQKLGFFYSTITLNHVVLILKCQLINFFWVANFM